MIEKKSIRIYSFYYKPTIVPVENELYQPLMVGNALSAAQHDMPGDDSGISISHKNRYYSELTGIYWVWQNTRHDITGCCHYRRYFKADDKEPLDLKIKRALYFVAGLWKKRYGLIYTSNIARFRKDILDEAEIHHILQSYDCILPQKRKLRYSVGEHYSRYHNSDDLQIILSVLQKNHPDYVEDYHSMLKGRELYANNMFVMPAEHFSRFMDWWFSVLFEIEKNIPLADYKGYQQRVLGFIAERMLTTWVIHENLKIKELPVIYFKKIKFTD